MRSAVIGDHARTMAANRIMVRVKIKRTAAFGRCRGKWVRVGSGASAVRRPSETADRQPAISNALPVRWLSRVRRNVPMPA